VVSSETTEAIDEVLALFSGIVAKDGGEPTLRSYDRERRMVDTLYREGTNEECPTCVITPESMEAFLLDALRARGVEVDVVTVRPPG
jgi:Fe-S cluster biogenesis protein NfuA